MSEELKDMVEDAYFTAILNGYSFKYCTNESVADDILDYNSEISEYVVMNGEIDPNRYVELVDIITGIRDEYDV